MPTSRITRRIVAGMLLTAAVGGGALFFRTRDVERARLSTSVVSRGSVIETVVATGTLQAVTTVSVGTQVSGTIAWLGADFNSLVRKGQVIARLDPSLLEAETAQARATRSKAAADVDNAAVQVDSVRQKYERAAALAKKQLISQSDFDAAKVDVDTAQAQLKSAEAQVIQAQAALNQNQVNLDNAIIAAPIDGIVIERSVDVGQTVAASLQSPTIFMIAADLTRMQVNASIDESDIGKIRPGQSASFTVDAYPADQFLGTVTQVRLQPLVVQNVTTYSVMLDVPNTELKLKPGMTANVRVEIARRDDVLRVPNAALRFRPTDETFAALGQTPVPDALPSQRLASDQAPATAGPLPTGTTGSALTRDTRVGHAALFAPLATAESEARVWLRAGSRIQPALVRIGLSDGLTTELVQADLQPGAEVVTGVSSGNAPARTAASAGFMMPGGGLVGGGGRTGSGPAGGAGR